MGKHHIEVGVVGVLGSLGAAVVELFDTLLDSWHMLMFECCVFWDDSICVGVSVSV